MKNRLHTFPFIKQAGLMECGTTCLAIIFKYYGFYDIRRFLSEKAEVTTEGVDLYTLSELGENFGFETDGFQLDYDHLQQIHLPAIAHYDGNHFVVVYKATTNYVWISDPAIGKYKLKQQDFLAKWNGIVLVLKPTETIFKNNELVALVEEEREKRKNIFLNFYLRSAISSKKVVSKIIICTLILQILGLALPFFTQTIIDQVLVSENEKLLYAILLGMVAVFASQIIITYGRNILLAQFKIVFERNFFSNFFDHFLRLKQTYFDNHKREDFVNRFNENLRIRQALNPSILEGVINFTFVATYLVVLFFYNFLLASVTLSFVFLYILSTVVFTPTLKNLENRIFAENVKTMGQFLDTLLGIQTVRLLGIEKLKFWKWKNQYTKALNNVLKAEITYIGLTTILSSLIFASQTMVYWIGAYITYKGEITIGHYIAFITIFTIIINSLSRVTHLWFFFTELSVTFDRLNDVLIQERIDQTSDRKDIVKSPLNFCLKNVNFKYRANSENYILKDINLEIKSGTFLGVVGRNGSGKSTLIKLLNKLYEGYDGDIFINNLNLKNILPGPLRKKIAVIPQEVFLFDGTLKENILYGNPSATNDEVIEAAILADLHDFVKEQFLGYNQKIGENGSTLSGGQKLKVAFARLFVANPDVIILDEASSALDVETEAKIMRNLREKFKGKTFIAIAHRLHTLRDADNIIVLDKGKIVERGSHTSLIEKNGLYKSFIKTYVNF